MLRDLLLNRHSVSAVTLLKLDLMQQENYFPLLKSGRLYRCVVFIVCNQSFTCLLCPGVLNVLLDFSYECWFLLALSLFLQAWIKKESEHSSSGKMASPLKIYRLYSMRSVGYIKYHDVLATFDFFFI